jgi:hypothetical protein
MNSIDRKKDMISFHWKLLIFQTIIYVILWGIGDVENALTNDGKILWKPIVITFYSISVLHTFIIPMIKLFKKK